METLELVAALLQANIPVTDVTGQQVIQFPPTTQQWVSATVTINRTGVGGTHPWINSLTPTDTLRVVFQYSTDNGATWRPMSDDTFTGETHVVKGQVVPTQNAVAIGIGVPFPVGTIFRVILTASTPLTFNGTAVYE